MDERRMQFFFSVAEHGNLSGAAQSLRVSQPTLSRHIVAMEEQFNARLFTRGARGMMLTQAGRQLQKGLQNLERHLRQVKADVASVSLEPSGEVSFGIPPSPRALIGMPVIKAFADAYPRIVVRVVEETSAQLRDLVSNGSLDVAIINTHEPSHGINSKPIGIDNLVLVGRKIDKFQMNNHVNVNELSNLPLILTSRPNSLRLIVENALNLRGIEPNVRFEADMLPTITDMVAAGLGYAVLPTCGVRQLVEAELLSAAPIKGLSVTWLVARPKQRSVAVAAERFYEMVCQFGSKQVSDGLWEPC